MEMNRLALVLVLVSGSVLAAGVQEQVDRFTGQKILSYAPEGEAAKFDVPRFAILSKPDLTAVSFMYTPGLGRYAVQNGLRFVGCSKVDWLIDGKPAQFGMVVHSHQRYDKLVTEFVNQQVTAPQLAQIGAAASVEYRLCGSVEGVLSPEDIAAAKDVASRMAQ